MFGFFKKEKKQSEKVEEVKEELQQNTISQQKNNADLEKSEVLSTNETEIVEKLTPEPDEEFDDFPDEIVDNRPLLKTDEKGAAIIPLDKNNKIVVTIDDEGKPILSLDENGKPIIPVDENNNPYFAIEPDGTFALEPPPPPPPQISIRVSPDNIEAFISVKTFSRKQEISPDQIVDLITNTGVSYGIKVDEIKTFCAKKRYKKEILVAQGVQPINCEDGYIEYFFKTNFEIKFVEDEKGTVNYRELGLIQNVEKGSVICKIHPPTNGKKGRNIFGEPVIPKPGKEKSIRLGENTKLADDKINVTA
ncbi:MAG: FapA family protein, partial [Oscillospiraceae bacterium]